ncbi:endolysin; inhibits RNA polymerase [Mycobacterium phage Quink]|uniref:dATP/dGTP diphosphohydrolase N-terminal domain-containing protein n=8 Tax=Kostyavirus TaxID=1623284 RepID=Q857Q0_9CAUD|nr:endolysin; inhibits RNA polymerase [Mycobacterium phage Cjw1]YP_008051588.1 endolysin; inhibits RNA polymerase [Mycobacterium phage Murphy]YP_008051735.1 endolysin; inhibits RNA polymerase [Mycobacterium phage Dumbo]YP_008052042.1 endolysin; inhibits RNA polymerase [Mycobacterium phage Phrux]YP_008052286.1 endolysin; inhibits RNA polymerase [Mycobacterium phage Phaux]YP_008410125.1 endolysin; inhibits RNA polymerase [Mycobacterium phage Contagion]YP_008531189.1 endolysin; inhibits RNA poly
MTELKDTNPKDAVGTAKVPYSTIPARVVAEVGLAMMEGALKYGRHNYRVSGVRASVYYDAAKRHLDAWWEGQDIDPDSGLPHLVKAIACLVVVRDSEIQGNWEDDRPPSTPGDWVKELNEKAKALLEKYPDPVPAHTQKSKFQAETLKLLNAAIAPLRM